MSQVRRQSGTDECTATISVQLHSLRAAGRGRRQPRTWTTRTMMKEAATLEGGGGEEKKKRRSLNNNTNGRWGLTKLVHKLCQRKRFQFIRLERCEENIEPDYRGNIPCI